MKTFCSVPYVYTLEITSACDFRCVGCGNVFPHMSCSLTPEQCSIALKRIAPYAEMFRITGGEPTRSPVFSSIIRQIDEIGKPWVLFTHGAWEAPETILTILKQCRSLDGILVSFHGHSAESYKAFTGQKKFDSVLFNIHLTASAGISVNTNTILTHKNIDNLPELVDLLMQAGASVVAFSRHYGAPIPGLTDISPAQYVAAIDQIMALRSEGKLIKFNNNIPFCLTGHTTQACPAGDTHCTITSSGKVRLCNHSPDEVGDILTTPIERIWQSGFIRQWRYDIPVMCKQCVAFEFCKGGCKAHARANNLEKDPLACGPYKELSLPPSTAITHYLYRQAVPKFNCSIRKETFGYLLINRSQILKVSDAAEPLLTILQNANKTLYEIDTRFGQKALNFIGALYDRHMIEISTNS